jgi:hypothetical protein
MRVKTNLKAGRCKQDYEHCERSDECCSRYCDYTHDGVKRCRE